MALLDPSRAYGTAFQEPARTRAGSPGQTAGVATAREDQAKSILPEDMVRLHRNIDYTQPPRIKLNEYKQNVGQDIAYIKETLRNKIAEYQLPGRTRLQVTSDILGNLKLEGHVPEPLKQRITDDLNNNRAMKAAYSRLSTNAPTLDYVDNVMKLSDTYGVKNSLFDSIVSESGEHNGLNDISLRFDRVKQSVQELAQGNGQTHLFDVADTPRFSVSA
ncbi:MAG: hypothetical protein CSB48_02000 [Proteobacteria bacterium]|nr:MAG: hypothetical protein CSB48_02000 [Pseudomonadota bacterium]PIE40366.1 MAG: hypothetical protein CSA51_01080 [Gammaproteobacteria bacterium]